MMDRFVADIRSGLPAAALAECYQKDLFPFASTSEQKKDVQEGLARLFRQDRVPLVHAFLFQANAYAWIARRLAKQNQRAGAETLAFLADRVEGNLLAAHQEVQKLALRDQRLSYFTAPGEPLWRLSLPPAAPMPACGRNMPGSSCPGSAGSRRNPRRRHRRPTPP